MIVELFVGHVFGCFLPLTLYALGPSPAIADNSHFSHEWHAGLGFLFFCAEIGIPFHGSENRGPTLSALGHCLQWVFLTLIVALKVCLSNFFFWL